MHYLQKFHQVRHLIFLTCLLLVTRIAFRSRYLYDIDSVNFALGLRHFDPAVHQPHPPGYFLYICLGRVFNWFLNDANSALVAVSIAASCGALVIIYVLADTWFGQRAALFTGLIFVFSPLVWFHGIVALTYAVETFFSGLTGYLCWRVYQGSEKLIVPAALTVGVAAGFRPSFLLFLSPLLLFSLLFRPARASVAQLFSAAGALGLAVAAWFLPMLWQSGGLNAYWSSLLSLWRMVPGKQTVFNSSIANSVARLVSIAGIYILCFGCATLLIFRRRVEPELEASKKLFMWIWIAPGLLFFTLVFLKFVNSGYLLVISPPVFAWLGLSAARWYSDLAFSRNTRIALVSFFAMANSLVFLYAPVYCSYTAVRRFEADLENVLRSIPQIASPADTMILGFDSHFLGYRHAGYYLPGWFTAQFPEVRLISGTRVFVMEHGATQLADKLPLARFKNVLFFPLPLGDTEYSEYMTHVRARFPKGALRTVMAGGREYTSSDARDMQLLFPVAARDVYAVHHAAPLVVDDR